jgi:hypothetical protein
MKLQDILQIPEMKYHVLSFMAPVEPPSSRHLGKVNCRPIQIVLNIFS